MNAITRSRKEGTVTTLPDPLEEPPEEPPEEPLATTIPARRVRFAENNSPELPPATKDLLSEAYNRDDTVQSILKALDSNASRHPGIILADCERRGNHLYYRNRLYVPYDDKLKAEILR